jgi:hypothetical protein
MLVWFERIATKFGSGFLFPPILEGTTNDGKKARHAIARMFSGFGGMNGPARRRSVRAFSSEVDTGSRQENAINKDLERFSDSTASENALAAFPGEIVSKCFT